MSPVSTLPPHKPAAPLTPADCARNALGWCEDLALQLETVSDPEERVHRLSLAVVATGGTWVEPPKHGTWGPHYYEVTLGGIWVTGATPAECAAKWIRAVLRIVRNEAEGGW